MKNKYEKKLSLNILIIIALFFCLTITSFALVFASVQLENNTIETGYIAISLNGGNQIISDGEFLLEPGMTIKKEFYLQNTSPCDVWYRFYFDKVEGDLKDCLEVTIKDGDAILYEGTVSELKKSYSKSAPEKETALQMNQTKYFEIIFHFPPESGNDYQNAKLTFDFVADAVQTKNNPNRLFND